MQHADLSALLRQPGVDQRVRLLSLTEEGRSQLAVAEPSVLRALRPMLEMARAGKLRGNAVATDLRERRIRAYA